MAEITSNPIAVLNDRFRITCLGGQVFMTEGIQALDEVEQRAVIQAVQLFSDFSEDNDPYGEHDCALFMVNNKRCLFKIDYYDLNMKYRSEDPADPSLTQRVLTIMLAEEY